MPPARRTHRTRIVLYYPEPACGGGPAPARFRWALRRPSSSSPQSPVPANTASSPGHQPAGGHDQHGGPFTAPSSISATQQSTVTGMSAADNPRRLRGGHTPARLLAAGKAATQSSVGQLRRVMRWMATPTAISIDPRFSQRLRCHAWWQIDLGASTSIGDITIWNRTDGAQARLNITVFVSNMPLLRPTSPPLCRAACGHMEQPTRPPCESLRYDINAGVQGDMTGPTDRHHYLHMAEVQVDEHLLRLAAVAKRPRSQCRYAVRPVMRWMASRGTSTTTGLSQLPVYDPCVVAGGIRRFGFHQRHQHLEPYGRRRGAAEHYWVLGFQHAFRCGRKPPLSRRRAATWNSHQTAIPSPWLPSTPESRADMSGSN